MTSPKKKNEVILIMTIKVLNMENNVKHNEEFAKHFGSTFYGIINEIDGKECTALIYDMNTYKEIDKITLNIEEFPKEDRNKINKNVIFEWYLKSIDGNVLSMFNLVTKESDKVFFLNNIRK